MTNEPGRTCSEDQSIRPTIAEGRCALKKAAACSGWENTALKKPSLVCAAGLGFSSGVSTVSEIYRFSWRRKKRSSATGQPASASPPSPQIWHATRTSAHGLNPENDRFAIDAIESLDCRKSRLELAEGAGVEEEDHVEKLGIGVVWIHRGMGAGDADAVVGKNLGDLSDHPGAIGDIEADIIGRRCLRHGEDAAVFAIGKEAAVTGGLAEGTRGFDEVGDDGGCRRILPRAAPVEKGLAGGIAMHGDGIENAVHGGEDMGLGDEGRLQTEFHRAIRVFADDHSNLTT